MKMAASRMPSRLWVSLPRPALLAQRHRAGLAGTDHALHQRPHDEPPGGEKHANQRHLEGEGGGAEFGRASAVMSASSSQPMTSLIAAALMAMTPHGRRVILNSIMMRPRWARR